MNIISNCKFYESWNNKQFSFSWHQFEYLKNEPNNSYILSCDQKVVECGGANVFTIFIVPENIFTMMSQKGKLVKNDRVIRNAVDSLFSIV